MNAKDKVKAFEADLKEKNRYKFFNIWAFLFSSFYFLYKEMFGHFVFFAITPLLLMLPSVALYNSFSKFWIGFAISHTIAGFSAELSCRNYKKNYIRLYKPIIQNEKIEYFAISLPRLIICTILTGGLYTLYWGFKNWDIYQKATNDGDVVPYFRAMFFNWTAVSLFSKINDITEIGKSYMFYGLACLLIFAAEITICHSVMTEILDKDMVLRYGIILFLLMLIYPFFLVPVQISINKYTTEILKKPLEENFYPWEIIISVLGIVMNLFVWGVFLDAYARF